MQKFHHTHTIRILLNSGLTETIEVHEDGGTLYTADEWTLCTSADWELQLDDEGEAHLLFQGEPAERSYRTDLSRIGLWAVGNPTCIC